MRFHSIKNNQVRFAFATDRITMCKKLPANDIDIDYSNRTPGKGIPYNLLIIALDKICDPGFNVLTYVHVIKINDIENIKRVMQDKLPDPVKYNISYYVN